MAQYIDKSTLVAELKKRIRDYWSDSENTMGIYPYALEEVIKYIDSLEMKEVQEESVSNDLEDYASKESESFAEREYEIDYIDRNALAKGYYWGVKSGVKWQKEQKSAWSEEDELYIRELESLVKQAWEAAECENDKDTVHKMSDLSFFLKTLKPQLKQEWSEEDEEMIEGLNNCLDELEKERNWIYVYVNNKNVKLNKVRSWLKSIKPQSQWKPSNEQMQVIEWCKPLFVDPRLKEMLDSLINDLKKLL